LPRSISTTSPAQIEQPEAKNDPPPATLREPLGRTLRGERGLQDRGDVRNRRVFGDRAVGGIDERHGGLDVHGDAGRERGVDQDPRGLRAQPVVLPPRLRVPELIEGLDPGEGAVSG